MVLAALTLLLGGQVVYVTAVLRRLPPLPPRCDLFVVFGGVAERIQRGIHLAASLPVGAFTVSDSSAEAMAGYLRADGQPGRARIVLEPDARHTIQNAWNTVRLAQACGASTVVVATSWYHVPRAALLMALADRGSGLRVTVLATEAVPQRWWEEPYFWVEFIKLWGSLGQWVLAGLLPAPWGGRDSRFQTPHLETKAL